MVSPTKRGERAKKNSTLNPSTPKEWRQAVAKLRTYSDPDDIRLSRILEWRAVNDQPLDSKLTLEAFLHFRALIVPRNIAEFDLEDHIDPKCVRVIRDLAKLGSSKDSTKAPVKKPAPQKKRDNRLDVPSGPRASCWMVESQTLIEYVSTLTHRWMAADDFVKDSQDKPSGRVDTTATSARSHALTSWTMEQKELQIMELLRPGGVSAADAITCPKYGVFRRERNYAPLLETQTDGYLYDTKGGEVLAIVETDAQDRGKDSYKIEWQEAAKILGWLNLKLREEREVVSHAHSWQRRRGLLRAPEGKYRCLLVSQNREQISIIIAEWDNDYECYALKGSVPSQIQTTPRALTLPDSGSQTPPRPPTPPTPPGGLSGPWADPKQATGSSTAPKQDELPIRVPSRSEPDRKGKAKEQAPKFPGSDSDWGKDGLTTDSSTGFLTLNVYGTFNMALEDDKEKLDYILLGLSMHLAQVSRATLDYFEWLAQESGSPPAPPGGSSGSDGRSGRRRG